MVVVGLDQHLTLILTHLFLTQHIWGRGTDINAELAGKYILTCFRLSDGKLLCLVLSNKSKDWAGASRQLVSRKRKSQYVDFVGPSFVSSRTMQEQNFKVSLFGTVCQSTVYFVHKCLLTVVEVVAGGFFAQKLRQSASCLS